MRLTFAICVLVALAFFQSDSNAQNQYRSRVTGSWNVPGTWEISTNNGSTWNTSTTTYPSADSAGAVSVRSGHIVTVPVTPLIRIDQLTVTSGGKITISAGGTLSIVNGTGDDLSVENTGQIDGTGNLWANASGTLISLNTGSSVSAPFTAKANVTVENRASPFVAELFGNVTVDAGAVMNTAAGGYTTKIYGNLINNGTMSTGNSSAAYNFAGNTVTNNGNINGSTVNFSDTTDLYGAGSWTGNEINILANSSVKLMNNIAINSTSVTTALQVNGNGFLDFNGFTLTLGAASSSKAFTVVNGGIVASLGTLNTVGTVSINIVTGALFGAKLKVVSGITTVSNSSSPFNAVFNNDITVDAGANLRVLAGGYTITGNAAVTNNGTISTGNSSGNFRMNGPAIINTGTISASNFEISSDCNITSSGSWTTSGLQINSGITATLLSDLNFGGTGAQGILLKTNSSLDLNGRKLTLNGATGSVSYSQEIGSTTMETGKIECFGTVNININTGGIFKAPVYTKTGITQIYNSASPFTTTMENSLFIDPGATFRVLAGGYTLTLRDSIVNNGTFATGSSSGLVRYFGNYIINNGTISVDEIRFESDQVSAAGQVRNVSGTGAFTSNVCTIYDGTYLLMTSNHSFRVMTINQGATLDIGSYTLKLTGGGSPISVSGGFINTSGTIEYGGTAAQTMVHNNINYINLNINNPAGVTVGQNFTIYGLLNIINGDLNLNGRVINFAANASLSETPGNTVTGTTGYITTTRNINAPNNLNVAGFGAVFTSTENFGLTEVRRGHGFYLVSGDTSIRRYYVIRPDNNNGLNATCSFRYDDSELNGNTESSLKMLKSTNVGASFFVGGLSIVDTVNNTVTVNSINDFARHTLGPGASFSSITVAPEGFYNTSVQRLNMKDTVKIELRGSSNPFPVIDSAYGIVDSVTLAVQVLFQNAPSGSYYIAVKHRNSIETWSATAQPYTVGSSLIYNFTNAQNKAFGSNLTLKGTRWLIFSGDVNQDGAVDATDVQTIDNDASNFVAGYVTSDLNGDGFVDGTDFTIGDNNAANFVGKVTP